VKKLSLAGLGLAILFSANFVLADCPEYLQGEYRKLHSGDSVDLCKLAEGKPVLVVNTASHCGFTKQFKGLEAVHQKYQEQGLVVVGFASDDFNQEAKNEEEAADICFVNFGVTFTMMAPTSVKGDTANPLFKELAAQSSEPKWNFNKYLLDKNGKLVEHFGSTDAPDSKKVMGAIETVL
jgi:glutathione peroxidase